ncbi:amino acid transporter [Musa troglodytarum]|uniref:Amino acid transporter n=1 Tax=Musa troglodytarum TaxID=320322 RepID=A0A9E7GKF8_9LILI|nr:amino acid transporter [Musa troglodytarum]
MECDLPPKTGTSFWRTSFHGVNALSGPMLSFSATSSQDLHLLDVVCSMCSGYTKGLRFAGFGILSIPYAVSQGGWLSMILLLTIAVVCCYTGILLQRCMDSNSLVKTYPDIGEIAFGHKGRILVSVFLYLELYLVATEFLILEGDNMEKLFPRKSFVIAGLKIGGKQAFTLLGALVILPTTWLRSLDLLSYVSLGGVLASLVVVASVLWAGAVDGVGFHERGVLLNWTGIPTAVSLYAFCYSGHAVFPTIYVPMKDRRMFPMVLFITFTLCTLNYSLMATIGYLMYGENLKSQITLNLQAGKLSSKIAICTTLITPFVKYALLVTPIACAIEDWLHVSKHRLISLVIRTGIVITTVAVALSVPFFGYIVALTGSFLSSTATMVLPCVCYLKIFKNSRKWSHELLCIVAIIVAGSVVAVTGTYASLKQIIQHL